MLETQDARTRLRALGQLDLGAWVEAATGTSLWSVQRTIAAAISRPHSRVVVPSCNASGKSFLAARLALAFYDSFSPGTPCVPCGGACRGGKVITTSSTAEHLRDALWGEMRQAYAAIRDRGVVLPGKMSLGQHLRLEEDGSHFIIGLSPNKAEGFQGMHAAHKLIIGDEATSLDDEMQQGIAGLLATGDSRLLLIFNPTTDTTYAALESRSPRAEVIKITAYDTPNFTGEEVPLGANLTTPDWLEELQEKGMGPGTYEWTTRVLAEFWSHGEDVLIPPDLYDAALGVPYFEGTRALGVDLAPYGTDENVIAYRDGNALVKLEASPSMRQDTYWETKVAEAVNKFKPHYLIWDADGVGAGVYGYADTIATQHNIRGGNVVLLPFRGGIKVSDKFTNARSAWWWALRRRFQTGTIALALPPDSKLRDQLTDLRYSVTDAGDIKIESKATMKKRGTESPDRGDSVMYAFSMVEELPIPSKIVSTPVQDFFGVQDRSFEAMRKRDLATLASKGRAPTPSPWDSVAPGHVWDDI